MTELMTDPALVALAAEITRHNARKFDMQNIFATHLALYRELAAGQGTCRMRKNWPVWFTTNSVVISSLCAVNGGPVAVQLIMSGEDSST